MDNDLMDKIVALCKRRGFIYPGSEIYGGLANSWDYGPVGVELKNNIKQLWWKRFVQQKENIVGLDAALIMNQRVWEASGHVENFTDPMVECKKCHARFRADRFPTDPKDKLFLEKWVDSYKSLHGEEDKSDLTKVAHAEEKSKLKGKTQCPSCFEFSEYTEARMFNLMFKTHIGPIEDESNMVYLRPETAQAIFVNFKNIIDTTRVKIPFGVAQIGKAFRNEITPGNFIFRTREFEQMEIEYFFDPDKQDWEGLFEGWIKEILEWIENDLGIDLQNIDEYDVPDGERAHYSEKTIDFKYKFPFGTEELYGLAYRGNYDLFNHATNLSNESKDAGDILKYRDEDGKEYFPHVIEPSLGVDRTILAVLLDAYTEVEGRILLKLHPKLAPYKTAVFPLLANKPELVKKAKEIYDDLKQEFMVAWDDRGNIGKRYASQDEIGTPYCITVDFDSLEDEMVTVRDRDSAKQDRVKIVDLIKYLDDKINI